MKCFHSITNQKKLFGGIINQDQLISSLIIERSLLCSWNNGRHTCMTNSNIFIIIIVKITKVDWY